MSRRYWRQAGDAPRFKGVSPVYSWAGSNIHTVKPKRQMRAAELIRQLERKLKKK